MRCYTPPHQFYGGIALHARTRSGGLLQPDGALMGQRAMQARPDTFLKTLAPSRDGLVVAVACLVTGYGLADRWAQAGMPLVLGQARSLQASHGGKATTDRLEAHTSAGLRRGGLLPPASVSPAHRRA